MPSTASIHISKMCGLGTHRLSASLLPGPTCGRHVQCSAKNRKKKERNYGSGRAQIDSSMTESLHFGRLIGETAKDTAKKLERRDGQVTDRGQAKDDVRAKLYLEKWEQEEDMSYSMFESLLNGKPLDPRSKKMKELEFENILELSTDDEVFQDYEAVALSSSDDDDVARVGGSVEQSGARDMRQMALKVCYNVSRALISWQVLLVRVRGCGKGSTPEAPRDETRGLV